MDNKKITVLKVEPGKYPKVVEIEDRLEVLQEIVGGGIGCTYPFKDDVALVLNDEGKLTGLPLNRAICDDDGLVYDAIAGTFLVVGLDEDSFASLTPELVEKYERIFHTPEVFGQAEDGTVFVLPMAEL